MQPQSVRNAIRLQSEDFDKAYAEFTPLSIRGIDTKNAEVSWVDIGGVLLHLLSIAACLNITARSALY